MATNRFPQWGDSGESPPTGFEYQGGDQVNEKHLDYLWYALNAQVDDLISDINTVDTKDVEDFSTSGAAETVPVSQGDGTVQMEQFELDRPVAQFGYGLLVGQTLESDESLYIPSDNSMVVADKYEDQGDLQVDGVLKVI